MHETEYSDTVNAIFEAMIDEEAAERALRAVAKYVGVSGACYFLVNTLTGHATSMVTWGCHSGGSADYLAHYSKIDPYRPIQERAAPGDLFRLSECLPQTVLRRDEWYNDYVRKNGISDVLGGKLCESPSHMAFVGLQRAIGDRDPFPRNPEKLQSLMGPLSNAARLLLGLIDMGVRSPVTGSRLDYPATAVIFTDADGRMVDANKTGEALLRLGDGLTICNGRICARRSFETTKLAGLIANATRARAPSACSMLVARGGERPAYVVRVAPHRTGDRHSMAMILVSVPDDACVSERELRELYGLSPAESRLALALERGKRLTELVADFGVKASTLRTQLRSTLKKCGVERQSDLVRLIARIPVVRPPPNETEPV